jgi:hypothetical protein
MACWAGLAACLAAALSDVQPSTEQGVTVLVQLVVQDAAGRPVTDLRLEEIEVVQEAERQRVRTLKALPRPGSYEVTYVPASGKAAGVTVRVLRPGTQVRGPDGPFLKPRILVPLSPLEAELTRVLETRPEASDLACQVAVLRFESGPKGVHHTVAVEVPLSALRWSLAEGRPRGRLQILARIKGPDGRDLQRLSLDRPVEVASEAEASVQRLVWTGSFHLPPDRYTLDVVVRDPASQGATTRALAFEAPRTTGGLSMSSVTLLQPRGAVSLREDPSDDPLFLDGAPLMPTLNLVLPVGAPAQARFFVTLYPDPRSKEPVSLRLEVYRSGTAVGGVDIPIPAADPNGEIRYVGVVPTRSFLEAPYALRLVARQGDVVVVEEASLTMTTHQEEPRLRVTAPD